MRTRRCPSGHATSQSETEMTADASPTRTGFPPMLPPRRRASPHRRHAAPHGSIGVSDESDVIAVTTRARSPVGSALADELEERAADADLVAVRERGRAYALAVDLGPVRGLEILDAVAVVHLVVEDDGVLAADALVEQRDIGGRVAPDQRLGGRQLVARACEVSVPDHEAGAAVRGGHPRANRCGGAGALGARGR